MKKIIIAFVIIIFALLLLPILGNELVKNTLNEKIELLKSKGIKVETTYEKEKYLTSSRHYEFILSDADKFLNYLTQLSNKELPEYAPALLVGSKIGMDLKYSNIPFFKDVSVDVYPMSISNNLRDELEKTDKSFLKSIDNFLLNKGLFCHLDYNIVTRAFKGYIKDIKQSHTMKNSAKLLVDIKNIKFNNYNFEIAQLLISMKKSNQEMIVNIKKFTSISTLESTSLKFKELSLKTSDKSGHTEHIKVNDIYTNTVLTTDNTKLKLDSKIKFSKISVKSRKLNFKLHDFNSEIIISDLNKDSLEKFTDAVSKYKENSSFSLAIKVKKSLVKLLSYGLNINISKIYAKNLYMNSQDLNGFNIKSNIVIKEDKSLVNNIGYNPMYIIKNLDLDLNLKVSKKIFSKLSSIYPIAIFAYSYAKELGDDLIYDIVFKDGTLKVNNKTIRK